MRISIIITLAAVARVLAAEPLEARWDGSVQIPGHELHVVIDLARQGEQWTGSAIVPGYAVKGAPLTGISVQGNEVSFTLKGALGEPKFTGRLSDDTTLTGEFLQAGNRAPFRLQKAGTAQVEPPRTGTAVSKELAGEWQGELTLNGTKMKATLTLTNPASGPASAQFLVVGKRENKLPVELVRQDGEWLLVEMPQYRMTFEARYLPDTKQLTGTFAQGPVETPLALHRAAK